MGEHRFLGELSAAVASPNLDGLAALGVTFTKAVSAAPFTTPSHGSIFTGQPVSRHGAYHQYKSAISNSTPTLAERLREAGYLTAQSAGRSPGEGVMFASGATGLGRGFDTSIFAGSVDRATRDWLKKARGRPWFLFFHTFAAHWPYGVSTASVESLFAEAWASDDWSKVRRLYIKNAARADEMVGELLGLLADLNELDRTIVVALADHGEGLNRMTPLHGPINGGREEVIRVPLILSAPWAVEGGRRIGEVVSTIDVLPTVLELVGLPGDDSLPGVSLLKPEAERVAYFAGHLNDDPLGEPLLRGLRTSRWKFLIDDCTAAKLAAFESRLARQAGAALKADLRGILLREMAEAGARVKLFDLAEDPLEVLNVAAREPELVITFTRLLGDALDPASAGGREAADDADLEEQLRALGYLT
jgi:arylsulfatase A-like enzyme